MSKRKKYYTKETIVSQDWLEEYQYCRFYMYLYILSVVLNIINITMIVVSRYSTNGIVKSFV